MIYLDNAATSYPKPFEVIRSVNAAFSLYGANPGRSGHDMSVASASQVFKTREKLNDFFNGEGSEFVSFFPNCTYALNIAIKGAVNEGEHIVISSMEHNSVSRPVYSLKSKGFADFSVFKVSDNPAETVENFKAAFQKNTRLCVVTAVSNVFGNILPLKELSEIAHSRGALFFVDGAQAAGCIELDMKKQGIDCLCVPGHKGLMGPMGTGALLHKNLSFSPVIYGGTGVNSFEPLQPENYPERLESGTLNVPGICGLMKGVEYVEGYGIKNIFKKETGLCKMLFEELKGLNGVVLYREEYDEKSFAPLVSFNIKGLHSEQVAEYLNRNSVAVRGGYHCSPFAHISKGTQDVGAVRVSPSVNNTQKDIKILLNLVRKIAFHKFI